MSIFSIVAFLTDSNLDQKYFTTILTLIDAMNLIQRSNLEVDQTLTISILNWLYQDLINRTLSQDH